MGAHRRILAYFFLNRKQQSIFYDCFIERKQKKIENKRTAHLISEISSNGTQQRCLHGLVLVVFYPG